MPTSLPWQQCLPFELLYFYFFIYVSFETWAVEQSQAGLALPLQSYQELPRAVLDEEQQVSVWPRLCAHSVDAVRPSVSPLPSSSAGGAPKHQQPCVLLVCG